MRRSLLFSDKDETLLGADRQFGVLPLFNWRELLLFYIDIIK
jgi:hypothetical protein